MKWMLIFLDIQYYFVFVPRQIQVQLHEPDKQRASRFIQETTPKDPLLVGLIGCGRLGSHLAHCLLSFAEVNPTELKISTRRPETLGMLFLSSQKHEILYNF